MTAHSGSLTAAELPVEVLRRHAEALPSVDAADFANRFDRFADARVVLLGEASHGTHEFYAARAAITRRLIERHGFNLVAVEGDWPDIARIDDYVRHDAPRARAGEAFVRFPTWMWRNREVLAFSDWLRGYNARLTPEARASMHGLDVYSLGASLNAVIEYLEERDASLAQEARQRYGCLARWEEEPQHYGSAVTSGRLAGCEDAVVAQLRDLLARRFELAAADGDEFFNAEQNARIVRAAEAYYRAMYRSGAASWNLRDRHMFDTLQALMAHRHDARAVVWAHNSHVGNAAATAMGWRGEYNVGELVRAAYGDRAVSIGFGTDRGTVAAASDWGGDMQVMPVRPARDDSWEGAFRRTGIARCLLDWRGDKSPELADALSQPLLERAIGVIYRPQSELASHYFQAVLRDQFDAFVWFEETGAVTPLGREHPHGAPEIWPFGL